MNVDGFELQAKPKVFVASIAGNWLLNHSTPSWRIEDPHKGFQRIVKETRTKQIAAAVLDQRRTFPNAIVLATNSEEIASSRGKLKIPEKIKFLVVDGQHRLWAQRFSDYEATYACILHVGLSEVDMARLFIEINDNQKRVPSSLRWDLVRLVRPEEREHDVIASEIVYNLSTEERSPLFQRIDRTGEQPEISLKQGSIAPEIRGLISRKASPLKDKDFETQLDVLINYIAAIRSLDPDGWGRPDTPFYKARVLRALLQLLPKVAQAIGKDAPEVSPTDFRKILMRIDAEELSLDRIRAVQGSSGIAAIRDVIDHQLFGGNGQ